MHSEATLLDALHPRFQRFIRFALGTGTRLEEIRGIDPKTDVNWIDGTVHVIGRFAKERDVPMQPDARAALEEYKLLLQPSLKCCELRRKSKRKRSHSGHRRTWDLH